MQKQDIFKQLKAELDQSEIVQRLKQIEEHQLPFEYNDLVNEHFWELLSED